MISRPADLKQSVLRDLIDTGALDSFPFKFRVTAFFISKGHRNPTDAVELFNRECLGLKKFHPVIAAFFGDIFSIREFICGLRAQRRPVGVVADFSAG